MAADRTRSEYRLASLIDRVSSLDRLPTGPGQARPVEPADRQAAAALLLDAYRGTIDDEGEDLDDALAAIDHYLGILVVPHSVVVTDGDALVAMSFVVVVRGVHYIDPVVTAAARKRHGLGRVAVAISLRSLAAAGVDEVGAVITDANTPSERLFTGLGFVRTGPWPPA